MLNIIKSTKIYNKRNKIRNERCIMSKNFDDLLSKLKGIKRKKLAVAVALSVKSPSLL